MSSLTWVFDRDQRRGASARLTAGGLLLPLALAAAVAILMALTSSINDVLIELGVSAVLVIGYQIFVGGTGVVSFGHVAFWGLGSYTVGVLSVPIALKLVLLPEVPFGLGDVELSLVPALLAAAAVPAIFALISGPVLMRLTGAAGSISTLALLIVVNELLSNSDKLTRGTQTFFGVPEEADFLTVYGVLCVIAAIAILFKFSPAGLRARAVSNDPLAAESAGIGLLRARMWPWVLSAAVTGVGGGLWAYQVTAFSPKAFFIAASVPIIVMAVLGGINSVTGAVVGTVALTAWLELMRHVEGLSVAGQSLSGLSQLSVGVGLIVVLWLRPHGLLGAREVEADPPRLPGRKR